MADRSPATHRVLTLCGSLRADSLNAALLRNAAAVAPAALDIAHGAIAGLPFYNSDVEAAGLPETVTRLREQIRVADALLIATPEYNHSLPGSLKNALDWISRPLADPVTLRKPVAIVSAGGRLGAARAQYHLRQICAAMGMLPMHQPELFVVDAWTRFDADGSLTDPPSRAALTDLMTAFSTWIAWVRRGPG